MPNKLVEALAKATQNRLRKKVLRTDKKSEQIRKNYQKVLDKENKSPIMGTRFDKFAARQNNKLERLEKRGTAAVEKYDKIQQRLDPEYGAEMKQYAPRDGAKLYRLRGKYLKTDQKMKEILPEFHKSPTAEEAHKLYRLGKKRAKIVKKIMPTIMKMGNL